MARNHSLRIFFLMAIVFGARIFAYAQADAIEHLWLDGKKDGKIQIYKAVDGLFYGKLVWIKDPLRNGKPKLDEKNPDPARRNDPELGLLLLKKFKKTGTDTYEDGTIYDPENGKTYSCKMKLEGDVLHVRGYIGFSLIGRTETWTKGE